MRWLILASIVLAGSAGYLTSQAIGGARQTPTKTVTINVGTGERGPAGPEGPPGPAGQAGTGGAENCPNGSTFGKLIINHPGGQTAILTCIVD